MPKSNLLISISGVSKTYTASDVKTEALSNVNLSVKKGDFLAITGRSGSGKSTLMHIIGLLDSPTAGKYLLNGVDVSKMDEDSLADVRNKQIGFVFQSFNLLPRVTAIDNVVLPSIYAGVSKEERTKKASEFLGLLGLSDHMNKKPNQLSGGQQQRVAIARALMNNPSIILADEPTGNLDTKSGNDVMIELKKLNKDGKTIIVITHEPDIAAQAKTILKLEDGKLKI